MFPYINVELTSRCNKSCFMCGRAKDRAEGKLPLGNIDFELLKSILTQFHGDIVQFNKDGEPLLYDKLYEIPRLCGNKITNLVTNGKLLYEKRDEIALFTSICVSVIEEDWQQFNIIKKYVESSGIKPILYIKFLGDYVNPEYQKLGLKVTKRTLHNPQGDFDYKKRTEAIPEIGVCLDFLMKPSIDWQGNFYICNRYDPEGKGIIGNVKESSLEGLWNSELHKLWYFYHVLGERQEIPLCKECQFWGIPRVE